MIRQFTFWNFGAYFLAAPFLMFSDYRWFVLAAQGAFSIGLFIGRHVVKQ